MPNKSTRKFGVDTVRYEAENPPHAIRVGNILYLSNSNLPLSKIDAASVPTEEFEIDQLQTGLRFLKSRCENKVAELTQCRDQGGMLAAKDEEWLDNDGNLVDKQLVIQQIVHLEEHSSQRLSRSQFDAILATANGYKQHSMHKVKNPRRAAVKKQSKTTLKNVCLATIAQKIKVINWHKANGENQTKTVEHFKLRLPELNWKQPTLSRWIKSQLKIKSTAPLNAQTAL
ncbi:hypothetical protein DFH28DRAFT_1196116 [Melampsora americana]|nr:hypothetical protein DFH28DRAFT_1196116 [Melampsora americana]